MHTTFITQVVSMWSRILGKFALFTLIGCIPISLKHSSCPVLNLRASFPFEKVNLSFWNRFCLNEMAHTVMDTQREGGEREYGMGRKREKVSKGDGEKPSKRERERESFVGLFPLVCYSVFLFFLI